MKSNIRGYLMKQSKRINNNILTYDELAIFFNELSLLYESGISISEALYIISDNSSESKTGKACFAMVKAMDDGLTPDEAADKTGNFPEHVVRMLGVGHSSGNMSSVLTGLAHYYERQDVLSKSIKSALTFPLIMVSVMFCVLVVLIVKVLPLFGAVYQETGAAMPWILRMVTESNVFTLVVILILVAILVALILLFTRAGKVLTSEDEAGGLLGKLPAIRKFKAKLEIGSFAYQMALLMSGGIPVEQALEQVIDMNSSKRIKDLCVLMNDKIMRGSTFSQALASCQLFDGTSTALLSAAEKAGHTDEMMDFISNKYSEETEGSINSLLGMIEPILVIVMSLLIGCILLSIMLPLMNVMMTL